jgi:hypothetical protein
MGEKTNLSAVIGIARWPLAPSPTTCTEPVQPVDYWHCAVPIGPVCIHVHVVGCLLLAFLRRDTARQP